MGKEFGRLIRARHLIWYSLSPFAQRPFAGYFREGIPNTVRRFKDAFLYPIPGFLMAGLTYVWMEETHHELNRKHLEDYENDV
ncbi:cytochrome b-c1 complex subunit 8-like [Corticium candelabrum]|uniref:cytochrome b-c1 complex subunit 8-like n=1 Tax=Corticium candelabrum TaxID=121492 RepID=UPI002E261305|nr:cytochrome b-c1 complex subunit 8-like [Corticium candelabrum]